MMGFAIRDGLILGITLASLFGFGPALLALLQTSLSRGFKSGFALAFGIFLSDLFLVMLSFEGVTQVVEEPKNKLAFGIVGGITLIVFGVLTYLKKTQIEAQEIKVKNPRIFAFIIKGFFLNVANPFIWLFWMGTMIAISTNYEKDESAILVMFSVTLLTVAGVGLILFGISLILRAFYF